MNTFNDSGFDWIDVCALDELRPGLGVCADVAGRQVALFRPAAEGAVHALDNHDPFSAANVLARGITGDLGGRPVVASPLYKQHFDLTSGECLEDAEVVLQVYPVRVLEGRVEVAAPLLEAAA